MDSADDTAEAVGCPIRKSTDQSLLAAPRGLSQRAASFIASQCQGIHQMPFRRLISLTNAPRAGESPQGTCHQPAPHPAKMHHMTQPTPLPLPEERPVGSSSVTNFFTCQRSHTRSRADICFLSHRISHEPGHRWSLKVTVRPCPPPWWRRTGSNRRPHACKARALPTELCPRGGRWWAREDLNFRPHAYQARALTN